MNIRSVSCGFGLLWPLLVWLTLAPWLMLRSMSNFFSLTLLIVHLRPIRYNSTSYLMPLMSVSKMSTLFLFLVLFERSNTIAGSSLRLKFHCLLKSIVLKSCQFSVFHQHFRVISILRHLDFHSWSLRICEVVSLLKQNDFFSLSLSSNESASTGNQL